MLTKLKYPTLSYRYDDEEEFIFCVKGRPFPVLVSPKLPSTPETLLDYDMVREIGLKMKELQCKRFNYGGYQMRVFGTVTTTVQCIQDGEMCGTTTIRADVIQNLAKNLHVECVASEKLASQLRGKSSCTSSGAPRPSSPKPSPKPKAKSSPPTPNLPKTPPRSPPPSSISSSPSPPSRSPPGFPSVPQYSATPPRAHLLRKVRPLSPWSANTNKFEKMFAKADLKKEGEAEFDALTDYDDAGTIDIDERTGLMAFKASDGSHYLQGHGRYKCSRVKCQEDPWVTSVPDNCGYNLGQWTFPDQYIPCGENCRGAFCQCLHGYIKR